ncbi:MAG: 3-hydroxy-3-methylglutaryl-CoA synthase, partial [Gammaproteobacteria bacterium]|nr:3-hydroxy-3-methylglutaryl-CoA synthase [Gammaproteobacteria bacterium]
AGKRVGFGSYGSGSSAMVFSGVIQPGYADVVRGMDLEAEIGPRRRLTWGEYEKLHENVLDPSEATGPQGTGFVLVDVKTESESRGERRYAFIE